ncbi:DUF4157 domain-containing protein [Streptomyces aurantiacus]|uniref:eCIS core domain-containing protein n=1 Tax=Streptomyces aurantiacus TaxID=47760 RepID=A0A7G1P2V8_9ACTN|nr:hypothetical protein GCM10017557_44380 [Streptomyces aurantiacus]
MRTQKQPSTVGKQDAARTRKPGNLTAETSRALSAGRALSDQSPQAILELQRSVGNAAVARRMAPPEQHEHNPMCGHGPAPKDSGGHQGSSSSVHKVLASPGKPLDAPVKKDMEARLNADFSDVRLHDDSAARAATEEVGARALTAGNHVALGPGGKDPVTLAHELTHVIQQRSGPVSATDNGNGLKVSDPNDRFEREAEANAVRVMSAPAPVAAGGGAGGGADVGQAAGGAVQRAPAETAVQRAADDTVVQRAGAAAATGSAAELGLMPGATSRALGGDTGFVKYEVPSIGGGVDPEPLYRGMKKDEFDSLMSGALAQGGSYQGFSPERKYSEGYLSNKANSGTHLVEFYRTTQTRADGSPMPTVDALLKAAGGGEKADGKILSTGVGEAATYSTKVKKTTKDNESLAANVAKAQADVRSAEEEVAHPKDANHKKHAEKRLAKAQQAYKQLAAKKPGYPAIGDAVKALNKAISQGEVAWRLVTYKGTS